MHRHILTLLAALLTLASPARATDRTLTFELTCAPGACGTLAKELTEQLHKRAAVFGLKGLTVTRPDARHVTARAAAEPGAAEVLRRPGHLTIHRIDDTAETWAALAELPAGVRLDTWGGIKGQYRALVSDDEAALHAAVAGRLPADRIPGTSFELSKGTGRLEFSTVLLHATPMLQSRSIATAKAVVPEDGGIPGVLVELTPAAGEDFERATAAVQGLRVAMVVDGDVIHTPKVREPITGGTLRLSKCNWRVDLDASVLARAYAAVLAAPYPEGVTVTP